MSKKRVHILGICGTFMGGLALLGKEKGMDISGCDNNVYPPMSDHLNDMGIEIIESYDPSHLPKADEYVIGNSIMRGNPALEHLLSSKANIISGPEWLYSNILKNKKVIAVSGTHGKTTTTSMVAAVLESGMFDPTVVNGGIIQDYGSNARLGDGDWMIVEADESDGTLIEIPSTISIITNLDPEHLDHYGTFSALKKTFLEFLNNSIPDL